MVWNETLKREIPDGWGVGVLSDIADITMGQSPCGESFNETGHGMIFFQGATDFGERFPSIRQFTTAPTRFAKRGDILLSVRAPVGTMNISATDCCIGRGLAAIHGRRQSTTYVGFCLKYSRSLFENRNATGTTFGSMTKDDLFKLNVLIPPEQISNNFSELSEISSSDMDNICGENQRLIQLRNWLLPMLMNGQAEIME